MGWSQEAWESAAPTGFSGAPRTNFGKSQIFLPMNYQQFWNIGLLPLCLSKHPTLSWNGISLPLGAARRLQGTPLNFLCPFHARRLPSNGAEYLNPLDRQGHHLHFPGGRLQCKEVLDQIHSGAWAAIPSLCGKDIILRTPRSLLAHQSDALHIPQFVQFCFRACLENAIFKGLNRSVVMKCLHPSRHPHTSIYLRRTAWSCRYFWNASTERGSIQKHHCSLFPMHRG